MPGRYVRRSKPIVRPKGKKRAEKGRKTPKKKRSSRERGIRATIRRSPKMFATFLILAIVILAIFLNGLRTTPLVNYLDCFSSGGPVQQRLDARIFIQVGERKGELAVSFIRLPDNMGVRSSCKWPIYTRSSSIPGERDSYYTAIHVESPYFRPYTLGDLFSVWGVWAGYPKAIYFSYDGISYYRTSNFELLIHRGWADPFNDSYETTVRSQSYGAYQIQEGDWIELKVREPFQTVPGPYEGGTELPIVADFGVTTIGNTAYFLASASGGAEPYTYEWDFGDGFRESSETRTSISHVYSYDGTFTVTLYVRDASGTMVTKSKQVTV